MLVVKVHLGLPGCGRSYIQKIEDGRVDDDCVAQQTPWFSPGFLLRKETKVTIMGIYN